MLLPRGCLPNVFVDAPCFLQDCGSDTHKSSPFLFLLLTPGCWSLGGVLPLIELTLLCKADPITSYYSPQVSTIRSSYTGAKGFQVSPVLQNLLVRKIFSAIETYYIELQDKHCYICQQKHLRAFSTHMYTYALHTLKHTNQSLPSLGCFCLLGFN